MAKIKCPHGQNTEVTYKASILVGYHSDKKICSYFNSRTPNVMLAMKDFINVMENDSMTRKVLIGVIESVGKLKENLKSDEHLEVAVTKLMRNKKVVI